MERLRKLFWIEVKSGMSMAFRVWNYEELDFEEFGSLTLWEIFRNLHYVFRELNN